MNLPVQLFTSDLWWLANFLFASFVVVSARQAPWRSVLDNGSMVNALVALTIGAFIFWQLNAGIRPGFNFHILGATLFTLMFGWQLAIILLTLVMALTWLRAGMDLNTLGLNGLLMISIPVLFSEWLLRYSKRNMPKNLFLFVLWNGFLCGAIAVALNTLVASVLLLLLSPYNWNEIKHHYLTVAPIIILTEAFMTGMLTTAFTVFQPEAMMNFSVADYLDGK